MRTVDIEGMIIDEDWVTTPEGWYHIHIQRETKEIKYYVNGELVYLYDNKPEWDN